MAPMTQPKKTSTAQSHGGHTAANDAGRPKSDAELRELAKDFILRHRRAYETLAK